MASEDLELVDGFGDLDMGRDPSGADPSELDALGNMDFDLALEDLGELIVAVNNDSPFDTKPGSFIGYSESPTAAALSMTTPQFQPMAGVARVKQPVFSRPGAPTLAAPPASAGVSSFGPLSPRGARADRAVTTVQQAPTGTVAALSAVAERRSKPVKRARTRYTAQPNRRATSASKSRTGSVGSAPKPAPAAPAEVGRKMRKNNRERMRRIEVNEGFATLAEVLHLQRKTKADKVTVLQSAIAEIRRLRNQVETLRQAASFRNSAPPSNTFGAGGPSPPALPRPAAAAPPRPVHQQPRAGAVTAVADVESSLPAMALVTPELGAPPLGVAPLTQAVAIAPGRRGSKASSGGGNVDLSMGSSYDPRVAAQAAAASFEHLMQFQQQSQQQQQQLQQQGPPQPPQGVVPGRAGVKPKPHAARTADQLKADVSLLEEVFK